MRRRRGSVVRRTAWAAVVALLVGGLGLPAVASEAVVAPEAASAVVPGQWIAKQHTELLGRAPTPAEWTAWATYYESAGCSTASLAAKSKPLLLGADFAARYPESEKAGRIVALTRAVFNHDPNTNDWAAFYTPYADGSRTWEQTVDLYFGSIFDSLVRPSVCSADTPGYGFGSAAPLDVKALLGRGASRTAATLQSQLDTAAGSCGTVALSPYEVVRVGGRGHEQLLTVPSCVTLTTAGTPGVRSYARQGRLVAAGSVCDDVRCVDVPVVRLASGAVLRDIWVDASAAVVGSKTVGVELMGSTTAAPGVVTQVRVSDPGPGGTGIRLYGVASYGAPCVDARARNNLVTGYGRSHALDPAARALWADGISVFCEDATVERNAIVDVGDWGIGLFGVAPRGRDVVPQRSVVRRNAVLSAGVPGSVAIGVDAVGECQAAPLENGLPGGVSVPCVESKPERPFVGSGVTKNLFWTSARTSFDVGLLVGGKTYWGQHGAVGRGVRVTGNTTGAPGARVNVGIAISGMFDALVARNTGASGAAGSFVLVDTIGGTTADLPGCPVVAVGQAPPALASVVAGSQPAVRTDLYGCLTPPPPTGGLERVMRTTAGGGSFVGERTGATFTPFGHNYGPGFDLLMDDGWEDPAFFRSIVADFVELRQIGTNVLRLHPQFNKFMLDPQTPNPESYARIARLADVAEDLGLYLDITGLGIWRPADNRDDPGDPNDADEAWLQNPSEDLRWSAQAVFWGEMARTLKDKTSILFFNLMNEPVVSSTAWGCPNGTGIFEFCFVQAITLTPGSRQPRDIARAWIGEMTTAIRAYDSRVAITAGSLAQFGWPPSWIGDITDMMVSHNYPGEDPNYPGDELAEDVEMAKSFKQPGKPLVIEEFSYTLGDGNDDPPDIGCWNGCLDRWIGLSRPEVNGWLGHASGIPPVELRPLRDLFTLGWIQFFQYEVPLIAPCGSCQPS